MNKKDTSQWEQITRNNYNQSEVEFTELLTRLEVEYNNLYKGFSSLWSRKISQSTAKRILDNYRAINQVYSKKNKNLNSLVKSLAATGLRDKLDNISSSIYWELKNDGFSEEKLQVIKPFLKSQEELLVEEKYKSQLIAQNMEINGLELKVRRYNREIESKYKEMQVISEKLNSSWNDSMAWNILTLGNYEVHPSQVKQLRNEIAKLESQVADAKNKLANNYLLKQRIIEAKIAIIKK